MNKHEELPLLCLHKKIMIFCLLAANPKDPAVNRQGRSEALREDGTNPLFAVILPSSKPDPAINLL